MPRKDEDFIEDDELDEGTERSRVLPTMVLMSALVAFVGLAWYAYQSGTHSVSEEDLVIVEAETTPMKEQPLDPGGMEFRHQDKSVFETITSSTPAETAPEQVISSAEEPMVIEQPATETIATTEDVAAPTESVNATERVAVQETAPEQKPVEAVKAEAPVEVKEVPVKTVAVKAEAPKPASKSSLASIAPAATKAPAPAAKSISGSEMIQLGAFRSEVDARAAWKKTQGRYSVLASKSPTIVRADLGSKGVFYRLRVANVNADAACATLKAGGSPCIRVKQ